MRKYTPNPDRVKPLTDVPASLWENMESTEKEDVLYRYVDPPLVNSDSPLISPEAGPLDAVQGTEVVVEGAHCVFTS